MGIVVETIVETETVLREKCQCLDVEKRRNRNENNFKGWFIKRVCELHERI